jgi:hypothetical protein
VALVLTAACGAWADHGRGDLRPATNPWWEAVLWGGLGLLAAITVALIVMVFTRSPSKREPGEGAGS